MRSKIPCPVCGVRLFTTRYFVYDRLFHTTDERFRIIECRGCGLMRLEPQPTSAEMSRYYPDLYWATGKTRRGLAGLYRRLVMRDHVRFIRKAIKRMGRTHGRVLDIGCGAGDLMAALRAKKHHAFGIDISAPALRSASQMGVPVARADHHSLPFAESSFDVVTMFHMLEHVPDPQAAIRAAASLLRPEGRLIIQIPNADCWQLAILRKRWHGLDVPRHLYDFRRQDLEYFLESNGFFIGRRKFFSWRDNAQALATSVAPWLDPMARRAKRPHRAWPLRLCGDLAYFGLVLSCLPFAITEALFRRGATLMVEAERAPASPESK